MAELLEQSEVDALLSAVGSGDAGAVHASMAQVESPPVDARTITEYDFKRPERVSKDQMRALEALHESFAGSFGASLSGFLRTIIECRVASCEQLTYNEFVRSLPSPTCFNVLRVPPLTGQTCLEISPLIVYPIIDRLLGGNSPETIIPQRALTNIEQRLVSRITERALACMTETWSHLVDAKFELVETESNPHLIQIVAPNEVVVVIGFEIKLGARSGTMSLCLPFNAIEPVMQKLATQSWLTFSQGAGRAGNPVAIKSNLSGATIEMCGYLARTRMSVRDLFSLAPGDVLRLDKRTQSEMIMQVEGRNKFAGRLGQRRGYRAFLITRRADPDERL